MRASYSVTEIVDGVDDLKHELIREYLKGWFPKMTLGTTGCRRLLYIDTHAGRGKHRSGQLGSPLVALTLWLLAAAASAQTTPGSIVYRCPGNVYTSEREITPKQAEEQGCKVIEGSGSRVRFERDGMIASFHRPHPAKEAKRYQVRDARDFLVRIGVTP